MTRANNTLFTNVTSTLRHTHEEFAVSGQ